MPVREMSAVRQIHRENLVAGFQHREVNSHVRLRAAVRLHVDVLAAEQAFRAIDRQLLSGIDVLAAAIPAFPRITFRVFVGQHAALSFHHRAAGEIFRGDQLDVLPLAFFFRSNRIKDFGIHFAQCLAVTRRPIWKRWIRVQIGGKDGPWNKKISPPSAAHQGGRVRPVLQMRARLAKRF